MKTTTATWDQPASLPLTLPAQRLLRYRWLLFAVLCLDGALLSFHSVWGATLSGYHARIWSLDASQLGLLAALGFLPYALMQIPGGRATDVFGGRRVLVIALAVTAAGTAIFALAPTFGLAAIGRLVIGAGSAVILLPSLVVLARWFRVREFATIQGGFLLLSAVGSLMATFPLAAAAERWSWRAPMLAVAIVTLVGASVTAVVVRNSPTDLDLPPIASIDPDAEANSNGSGSISLREGLRLWRSVPTLWAISLILFASWGSLQAFQSLWAGPLLRHVRDFSPAEVGQTLAMFTVGLGIGPVVFGWISDRVVRARRPVVISATIGQAILWLVVIVTIARLPTLLMNLMFLGIALLSGGVLVAQVMVKEISTPAAFGTMFGIINGSGFYGTAAIQLTTGAILSAIGPVSVIGEPVYGAHAYLLALLPIVGVMAIAVCVSFRLRETLERGGPACPRPIS